jgi:hypothetical protein
MSMFKKKKATAAPATAEPVLTPVAAPAVPTPDDAAIRQSVRMEEIKSRRAREKSKTLLSGSTKKPGTTSQTLLGKM